MTMLVVVEGGSNQNREQKIESAISFTTKKLALENVVPRLYEHIGVTFFEYCTSFTINR